jgi:Uma2 family endonuclease
MATDMLSEADHEAVPARLPDHYEVVNGLVVEKPPMSGLASEVANRIRDELTYHGRATRTGRTRNDMLFRLPLPEDRRRNREPDVAFISFERWPEDRPMPYLGNPVDVVPDLMVEVASPTDRAEDLLEKAYEYLRAGCRLVWLVYPRLRQVHAYHQQGQPPRVFGEADTLDAGELLPGLGVPMAGLFPAVIGLPDAPEDD